VRLALALAALAACSVQKLPVVTETSTREDFIQRGQLTFANDTLVGPEGQSCASCHENHVPFEDYSLARKYYELPQLVDNCLYNRTKHVRGAQSEIEARALREYVVFNYVLKGVISAESPEGVRRLGEAMENFLRGDYDQALGEVRGARDLVQTQQNKVQSFALEGCIQLFKLDDEGAKQAFMSALKLNPEVRIDGYVFSPKVLRVLESTRAEIVSGPAPSP